MHVCVNAYIYICEFIFVYRNLKKHNATLLSGDSAFLCCKSINLNCCFKSEDVEKMLELIT